MVCNLNWFACSSPWRLSGSIFDLQNPKILDNCLLERFSCPVESIAADYRSSASRKGKEVTCTIPFLKRSLALFPERPLGSGIAYIFLCAPVQNICLLAFTEIGGVKYRAI